MGIFSRLPRRIPVPAEFRGQPLPRRSDSSEHPSETLGGHPPTYGPTTVDHTPAGPLSPPTLTGRAAGARIRVENFVPHAACFVCAHYRHDRGQNRIDQEGLKDIPRMEGGLFKSYANPDGVGLCALRSGRFNRIVLVHPLASCPEWTGLGGFGGDVEAS